jgi:hypothetical protein
MKINTKAFALSLGIIWGLAVFMLTAWFLIMHYQGNLLSLLGGIYLGYTVSWIGAFVGLIYGFVDGLIFGAVFGFFYNKFAK